MQYSWSTIKNFWVFTTGYFGSKTQQICVICVSGNDIGGRQQNYNVGHIEAIENAFVYVLESSTLHMQIVVTYRKNQSLNNLIEQNLL